MIHSFGYFKYNADNNYKKIWEYGMHKSNGKVFTISLPTTFRDFLYTYDVTENEEFEDEIDNSPIYVLRDESLLKNLSTKWKVDHEGTLPDNLVMAVETKIRQQDDAGNLMFDGKRPLYMDRYVWGTLDKTGKRSGGITKVLKHYSHHRYAKHLKYSRKRVMTTATAHTQ